ncbi:hypothetical protein LY78DRAFT_92867 [Colletotrichum sublineola]|nr:hypothetical protein LY78DRAFT_92867 [Colletotrichum sublineola]
MVTDSHRNSKTEFQSIPEEVVPIGLDMARCPDTGSQVHRKSSTEFVNIPAPGSSSSLYALPFPRHSSCPQIPVSRNSHTPTIRPPLYHLWSQSLIPQQAKNKTTGGGRWAASCGRSPVPRSPHSIFGDKFDLPSDGLSWFIACRQDL